MYTKHDGGKQPVPDDAVVVIRCREGGESDPTPAGNFYWTWDNTSTDIIAYRVVAPRIETDPLGRDPHQPGAKLDAGKQRPALVLGAFANALKAVVEVGTYGAAKYTPNGWLEVPDGIERYGEAKMRHQLAEMTGEVLDPDTGLRHAAHEAWNALARLELILRGERHE